MSMLVVVSCVLLPVKDASTIAWAIADNLRRKHAEDGRKHAKAIATDDTYHCVLLEY